MDIIWNEGEKKVTRGLDILGCRSVDQDTEKPWVSGNSLFLFNELVLASMEGKVTITDSVRNSLLCFSRKPENLCRD